IDALHLGLVLLVDLQLTTRVGGDANGLQVEPIRVAGAAIRPEYDIALDALTRLQVGNDVIIVILEVVQLLVVAAAHAEVAQVVAKRIGDFIVEKGQQAAGRIDQFNLDAKTAKDGGIFTADHARADDG